RSYREAVRGRPSGLSAPDSKIPSDFPGRSASGTPTKPTSGPPNRAGTRHPSNGIAPIPAQPTRTRRIIAAAGLPSDERIYPAQHVTIRRPDTVHVEEGWRVQNVYRLLRAQPDHHQVALPDSASRRTSRPTSWSQVFLENRHARRLPSDPRRRRRLSQDGISNPLRQLRVPGDAFWPHERAFDLPNDHEWNFQGTLGQMRHHLPQRYANL
ncbi:hypothetical protein CLOP_g19846, partial [Closterium sp. NIES-67]